MMASTRVRQDTGWWPPRSPVRCPRRPTDAGRHPARDPLPQAPAAAQRQRDHPGHRLPGGHHGAHRHPADQRGRPADHPLRRVGRVRAQRVGDGFGRRRSSPRARGSAHLPAAGPRRRVSDRVVAGLRPGPGLARPAGRCGCLGRYVDAARRPAPGPPRPGAAWHQRGRPRRRLGEQRPPPGRRPGHAADGGAAAAGGAGRAGRLRQGHLVARRDPGGARPGGRRPVAGDTRELHHHRPHRRRRRLTPAAPSRGRGRAARRPAGGDRPAGGRRERAGGPQGGPVPADGPDDVRRRVPVRLGVPDREHLLDAGEPAVPRVRAAACRRRHLEAGLRDGRRGGARGGRRRIGRRLRPRRRSGARHAPAAARLGRPAAEHTGDGPRLGGGRRPGCRHHGDGPCCPGAGLPSRTGHADGSTARTVQPLPAYLPTGRDGVRCRGRDGTRDRRGRRRTRGTAGNAPVRPGCLDRGRGAGAVGPTRRESPGQP